MTGAVEFSGVAVADAEAAEDVFARAIARVAGVNASHVRIVSISEANALAARRRLDEASASGGVIVEYEIDSPDAAAAEEVLETLEQTDAAAVTEAIVEEAAAADPGISATLSDVEAVSIVSWMATDAPTIVPDDDRWWSKKETRKAISMLLIIVLVCVVGCCVRPPARYGRVAPPPRPRRG